MEDGFSGPERRLARNATAKPLGGGPGGAKTKRAILQIDPAGRLMRVQRDFAVALLSSGSLKSCFETLLGATLKVGPFTCGAIYERDSESGALRLILRFGLNASFAREVATFPPDSPQAAIIAAGRALYSRVADLPPEIREPLVRETFQSIAILPIRCEGRIIGSLNLAAEADAPLAAANRSALETMMSMAEGACNLIRAKEELENRVRARTVELETAHQLATENFHRLELALDASEIALASWDLTTFRLEWENRLKYLYGFTGDEELTMEALSALIHPDDREDVMERMNEAIQSPSQTGLSHEFRILHPTRGLRWIHRRARIERDAEGRPLRAAGVCIDITRRKQHEDALGTSETKYQRLHDSMTDAFASVGLDGRIVETNQSFQHLLGYSADELRGRHFLDLTPAYWHEMEMRLAESPEFLERGFSDAYEKEYFRKDGSIVPVELRASLVRNAEGNPELIWAIIRDITDRKQAERQLLQWNRSLETHISERTAQLRQTEARLTELQTELRHAQRLGVFTEVSAGILHQVGQPLCSIELNLAAAIGHLEQQLGRADEAFQIMADVESEIRRLRNLVIHLKSLAKPGPRSFHPVDLNAVVHDVARVLETETKRHQTTLVLALADQLPPLRGNTVQLSQVVVNLIQNAIDSCASRSSTGRQVEVRTGSHGNESVRLTVTDTGPGIPNPVLGDLFAPFLTTKSNGLGIGLRLSKTIVQAHGGTISGTNLPAGSGAVFDVILPLRPPTDYTEV